MVEVLVWSTRPIPDRPLPRRRHMRGVCLGLAGVCLYGPNPTRCLGYLHPDRRGDGDYPSDDGVELMDPKLIDWLAACRDDPLAFCLGAFPWGEEGQALATYEGPSPWQREVLEAIRVGLLTPADAIQLATASGHGIGKSALVAMIILWAFMTYPDARGVITANTEVQLKTKTWAELGKWFNLCFFSRDHFTLTAT